MKLNLKQTIKDGVVNIEELKDSKGNIDFDATMELAKTYPVLPAVTRDQIQSFSVKKNRIRKPISNRLPTFGLDPLPVDEHEHIGQYESKQNLYLMLAHAYNTAMDKIDLLEARIKKLESRTKV